MGDGQTPSFSFLGDADFRSATGVPRRAGDGSTK